MSKMRYGAWGGRVGNTIIACLATLFVWYAGVFMVNLLILLYAWALGYKTTSWLSSTGTPGHSHFAGHWPDWALTIPVRIALVGWPTFILLDLIAVSTWLGVKKMVSR